MSDIMEQNLKNMYDTYSKMLEDKDQKLADLEAKLAESEKLIGFYINSGKEQCDEINKINHRSIIKSDEIDQLKQQLAEKEKELQEVMGNVVGLAKSREIIALEKVQRFIDDEIEIPNDIGALMLADFFNKEIEKIKTSETYVSYEQSQNQTAIAELEKVIKFMKTRDKLGFFPEQINIAEFIEQQISVLKGDDV